MQVEDAGGLMKEIVASVQRGDIIGEISAAASEQTEGIGRVNQSVVMRSTACQQKPRWSTVCRCRRFAALTRALLSAGGAVPAEQMPGTPRLAGERYQR